jgi:4-aminobutyrate aminotransferase-like enzyme
VVVHVVGRTQPVLIYGRCVRAPRAQLEAVLATIKKEHLLDNVKITGDYILKGLTELQGLHPSMSNARGIGTFIAWDLPTPAERDAVVANMRAAGALRPRWRLLAEAVGG